MFLNTRTYRFVVCLLAVILLMSFNGAALAHMDACPCCGSMTQSGHMQGASVANCCNTPACDHCAINTAPKPTPVAAANGPNSTYRNHPTQLFLVQVAPIINLSAHRNHFLKNTVPLGNHLKIPIYLNIQSILC